MNRQTIHSLGEAGLIDEVTRSCNQPSRHLKKGIGDDAAVLKQSKQPIVVTKDLLQQGIHFRPDWSSWNDIGYKAIQVNLSDIAAMGAQPTLFWLGISLPRNFPLQDWRSLKKGITHAIRQSGLVCAGGDTTASSAGVTLSITMMGQAPNRISYRHQARVGDHIYVTGQPGTAGLGLLLLQKKQQHHAAATTFCRRWRRPQARWQEAQSLVRTGAIHAMIDLSDGLVTDLGHITKASHVGATVELNQLRISRRFHQLCQKLNIDTNHMIATGGEDYELLFTTSPKADKKIGHWSKKYKIPVTCIGTITKNRQTAYLDHEGHPLSLQGTCYEHF